MLKLLGSVCPAIFGLSAQALPNNSETPFRWIMLLVHVIPGFAQGQYASRGHAIGTHSMARAGAVLRTWQSVSAICEGSHAPQLPLIYYLLFGALISPTDPIAVMSILRSAHAPKELELVIAGESLFNDGVGVVIFSLLLGMLTSGTRPAADRALQLLAHEAGGGVLFGLVLGYVLFRMLKSVDSYEVEGLLTLAAVIGLNAACAIAVPRPALRRGQGRSRSPRR